jgi:ATP synthase protein I
MAGEPDRGGSGGGAGVAWSVLGTLIAGLVAWGGIGYLIDRLTGLRAVFLPIGLLVGAAGALWLILIRYGRNRDEGDRG